MEPVALTIIVLYLVLIPSFGALGGAIAICLTMVVHSLSSQACLLLGTDFFSFQWRHARVYAMVALSTMAVLAVQLLWTPPIYVGLSITGVLWLLLIWLNRNLLNVENMCPELRRFPLLGHLLGRA